MLISIKGSNIKGSIIRKLQVIEIFWKIAVEI